MPIIAATIVRGPFFVSGTPSLVISSGLRVASQVVSVDYDLLATDCVVLVNASNAPVTISLPQSLGNGQIYRVKKIDDTDNVVTVEALDPDVIDDSSSVALVDQFAGVTVIDAAPNFWDNAT